MVKYDKIFSSENAIFAACIMCVQTNCYTGRTYCIFQRKYFIICTF